MSCGQEQTRNNVSKLNPIIVKEVARVWTHGDKKINKALRRYGVIAEMMEDYRDAACKYYNEHYA